MDSERLKNLEQAGGERQVPSWVKGLIEDFVSGKEATMEASLDEQQFNNTLAMLQIESFNGDDVLGYHIQNTQSQYEIDTVDRTDFRVPKTATVAGYIEMLADMQSGQDFPNDFQLSFALRYDETTAVVIGKHMEECALHCDDCAKNIGGQDENTTSISNEYSCSHMDGQYDYISSYRFGMMRLDEFEDRPDWAMPYEIDALATDEKFESKKGVKNGRFELWEAEVGDMIRITAEDARMGQYLYEFTIVNAGNAPRAIFKQTSPDGSVIEHKDVEVSISGSGQWTNWRNNPMVKGWEEQIAISHGHLYEKGQVLVIDTRTNEQYELRPAATKIEVISHSDIEEATAVA